MKPLEQRETGFEVGPPGRMSRSAYSGRLCFEHLRESIDWDSSRQRSGLIVLPRRNWPLWLLFQLRIHGGRGRHAAIAGSDDWGIEGAHRRELLLW